MSTIIDRINSINQGVQDVKADFKTALENKGVEVADTLKLKDYPPLIEDIQSGGGRGIGKYIGEIFAYPSALPPAGAFLLNGQTIPNCQETYKEFWNWLNDGVTNNYIRTLTNSAYEAEITEYGMCDAFAISGSDVRLPKWNGYQTPLGNSVPVIGNGLTMGLTDGANTYGLRMYKPGISARSDSIPGETLVGAHIGGGGTMLRDEYAVGLSTDPTKSGIIADTSGLYPDRWSWVIQVFNTATDLSNQESAQLSSQMQMKAQKDLANIEETLSDNFFDKIMPDYTAGVSVGTSFEAVTYGLVYYLLTTTIDGEATVNGVVVSKKFIKNENDYASFSQTFYVSKGDIVIIPTSGIFYPLKGADK